MEEKKSYKCTILTKKKLMDSVISLAREKGYDNVTVRDILKKAGVSTGAFYHHYSTKDALIREAYLSLDLLITDEVLAYCLSLSPLEALNHILEIEVRYIQSLHLLVSEYYKILLSGENITLFDPDRPYYQAVYTQIKRCQKEQRFKNQDAKALTEQILRFLRGCMIDWCIHNASYDLLDCYRRDFSDLLTGLLV